MKTRAWVAGLTGATLVATIGAVAIGTATTASAGAEATAAGAIVLTTTYGNPGTGQVTYTPLTGNPTTSVLGRGNRCALTLTNPGSILSIESTPSGGSGTPGFGNGGIGVSSANKRSGTACTQVNGDAAEALTLKLDGSALGTATTDITVYGGQLDVEVKGNARIVANTYLGSDPVDTYVLLSGTNVGTNVDGPGLEVCNGGTSDSGPDSQAGDNCIWPIGQSTLAGDGTDLLFDKIVITPVQGSFSLEGGSDWSGDPSKRTVFNVASAPVGTLGCDATNNKDSSVDPSYANWGIEMERMLNGDGTCNKLLPYDLVTDATSATFLKPADIEPKAQFRLVLIHKEPTANPPKTVYYDWEDGSDAQPLPVCDPSYYNGVVGGDGTTGDIAKIIAGANPVIDYNTLTNTVPDASSGTSTSIPGYQHACVFAQTSTALPDGGVIMSDYVYLTGDIKFTTR